MIDIDQLLDETEEMAAEGISCHISKIDIDRLLEVTINW
jgi:hypothetical protein